MCGICGAVGFENAVFLVQCMNQAMMHRGPDSDGLLKDGAMALGMRRLKIIDLRSGDQPIFNEDQSVAIVFNGEIYNFREIRQELVESGHSFTTRSDTEVIVHSYEQWGKECLERLRGMFAFAIWDRRALDRDPSVNYSRRLVLARDRLGIKPLYIWQDGKRMLFASEVRALLASGVVPRKLSAAGLYTYLSFGSVQEPLTTIDGITSLSPGSWLQLDLRDGKWGIATGTYWRPLSATGLDPTPEDVRAWLADAVQSHLISEVPLGSFLSGGLDSGAIVALASQASGYPTRTFTLAFDNWLHDEREKAQLTAECWHTDHQLRVISQEEVLADLPKAIAAMDQPTIDGINTWYVSREAKRSGLTVAFSGVGGDELFAGYPSFRQVPHLKRIQRMGRWLPRSLASIAQLEWLPIQPDRRRKLCALVQGHIRFDHPYFAVRSLFTLKQLVDLLQPQASGMLSNCSVLEAWKSTVQWQIQTASQYDWIGETSWLELSQYMRSTLLRDTDAMSMAHSLEVRVPLVDHLLLERILPVKGNRKLDRRQSKPLLAGAVGEMLPAEVVKSRKRTFTFPLGQWLSQELSSIVSQMLLNPTEELVRWVNPTAAKRVWLDFEKAHTNWARPWALYVLDAWIRENV